MTNDSADEVSRAEDVAHDTEYEKDTDSAEDHVDISVESVSDYLDILDTDCLDPQETSKYAWCEINETMRPLLACIKPSLRREFMRIGHLPGPRRYELGRFQLHKEHLAVFEAVPALGEVSCCEVGEPSLESTDAESHKDIDASPLLRFLQLSNENDPVPEIIVDLDETREDEEVIDHLRKRNIVSSLDPVGGHQAELELVSPTASAAVWTCFVGGYEAFANAYCPSWDIEYCDNGAWYNLIRTSAGHKRRHSFTRVASCFGTAQVYHYYWGWWPFLGWQWWIASQPFEPNQQLVASNTVRSKHIKGAAKRYRKVWVSKWDSNANAYFRVFTSFHN